VHVSRLPSFQVDVKIKSWEALRDVMALTVAPKWAKNGKI